MFSLAGGLCATGGFGVARAALGPPVILKPFAHSRTVSRFAKRLFLYKDAMPLTLRRAIETELARTDVVRETTAQEREHAAFFSRLAVRNIAPRALRRAGYEQMAADLANEMRFPEMAQHAVEWGDAQGNPRPGAMSWLESCAYGACAHASTTEFYARCDDMGAVFDTGPSCARALLAASFYDDDLVAEDVWNFAARAINAAINLRRSATTDPTIDL